jgi:hypothetical protein
MYVNAFDVDTYRQRFSDGRYPNLGIAAHVLSALVGWTNANSDGWPHWQPPRRAASRLSGMLSDAGDMYMFGTLVADIPDADLMRALVPIKSFLRRQGVNWHDDLPWAAILPAT